MHGMSARTLASSAVRRVTVIVAPRPGSGNAGTAPRMSARSFASSMVRKGAVFRSVIMGPPGSGKGTIAARIVNDFKLQHLSAGDVLRDHVKKDTELGRQAKGFMNQGKLLPDELIVDCMLQEIKKLSGESYLLDGFPRTLHQAKALHTREEIALVINLHVPFATIIDRLSKRWWHPGSGRIYNDDFNPPKHKGLDDVTGEKLEQREDDKAETVQHRLKQYKIATDMLITFYRHRGILAEFHGTETNVIWPEVKRHLEGVFRERTQRGNDDRNGNNEGGTDTVLRKQVNG